MAFSSSLLPLTLAITQFIFLVLGATLAPDEVATLRSIANTLRKKDWNFDVDPCSGHSGWFSPEQVGDPKNAVKCNCNFSNSDVCHVVSIILKEQSLPGTLPPELVKLPYLQTFDVSRNYLSGAIPSEWASLKLINLSLMTNRLTGPIPKELGKISTLIYLQVEFNQLSGPLPTELGNLINMERLLLSSNRFSGELPVSFANLIALTDFRISDNLLTGKIPDFIQNWINISKLLMQASGLSGPIPLGIARLEKMTDLRISDLPGTTSKFPLISNMKNLETLVLSSCNIIGQLPDLDGSMQIIKDLDLSFNNLAGEIPPSYANLSNAKHIYFTGNALTGSIPDRMLKGDKHIDLSYNNFTNGTFALKCQEQSTNLFGSSLRGNSSGIVSCLRSFKCPKTWHSFHINCGGKEFRDGNTTYEEDTYGAGAANFYQSKTNWAFSSTGHFLSPDKKVDYVQKITSTLSIPKSELYVDARLSPLSLTYYGFCLGNGNYIVDLHFAEIMFTDDKTYSSLGRRVFDIYIQGKLEFKDFNIVVEAKGAGKGIKKSFPTVVAANTLEISFHWAGKGTTGIPFRSVYGPLISAISVNPNRSKKIPDGAIVAIVGAILVIFLAAGIFWWKYYLKRHRMAKDLRSFDLQIGSFTLRQIKAATNNFDPVNKIGEGGFGSVYKGLLSDGTIIAVKQLSSKSKQGNREFVNEIGILSALQHPHLVKLYGCCIEGKQLILVYEYMENNCLGRALFGPEECQMNLDWSTRHRICVGIARGLAYLHEESRLKIVHRDIKATNILLDKDLSAKISDFGLAKLHDKDDTRISTRIAGTFGYMAPEYAMRGYLTDKADVYSFGIVALEIVSGRSNTSKKGKENSLCLLDWAQVLKQKGQLIDLVDPKLESNFNEKEARRAIRVALLCVNVSPVLRPPMSSIVRMLLGKSSVQEIDSESSFSRNERSLMSENRLPFSEGQSLIDSQSHRDGVPYTGSTTSASDLYPIDSNYLDDRN